MDEQRTSLKDQLSLLRMARRKHSEMQVPIHPDIVDLCQILDSRFKSMERKE